MAWQDRVREAAYTSPGGTRLTFDYEDVGREFDKRVAAFDFPDASGTYVQTVGRSSKRYPLRVYLWGPDYDRLADAFEKALAEPGVGKLEHPIYGTVDVVPAGTITRRDDLKTGGNQAVIELAFWETIGLVYPTSQSDPAADVLDALDGYNTAAAEGYADLADLATAVERALAKNAYTEFMDSASDALDFVARQQEGVERIFNAIYDSITLGIDTLISDPLTLAFQTTQLIQAPSRAAAAIRARLSAYSDLLQAILSGNGADVSRTRERDLFAGGAVSGAVLAVVNNQFETKAQAIDAATTVLEQWAAYIAWRDENLGGIDTGEAYQQLQRAVALTTGFLVEISFTLKQERRVVLDRARSIIDLCAELYGEVDPVLDFFIESNDLTGSEILELPRGRAIVYYV